MTKQDIISAIRKAYNNGYGGIPNPDTNLSQIVDLDFDTYFKGEKEEAWPKILETEFGEYLK